MIDNIRLSKRNIDSIEVESIVKNSFLKTMYDPKTGKRFFCTGKEKELNGGMYIKIDIDNNLTITGSLHKYSSFLKTGKNSNFDRFTMIEAKETFYKLIENKGINLTNLKVNNYEVGLNLIFDFDVITILENVYSIGTNHYQKKLYIDPRYRQERFKTTERSTNIRVYYKLYDKVFETKEKRNFTPKEKHILRIETTQRKLYKTFAETFFSTASLNKIKKTFFNKWRNLIFNTNIKAPKGTHKSKIELALELYRHQPKPTINKYNQLFKEGAISVKIHRNIREFINNWNTEKRNFKLIKSPVAIKWANTYNIEEQIHSTF